MAELSLARTSVENVWFWQSDEYDQPTSLACPVVMSADTLRKLVPEPDVVRLCDVIRLEWGADRECASAEELAQLLEAKAAEIRRKVKS